MGAFIETLRSGQWLTRDRMRLWGLAVLAASAVGFIYILATSDGLNDYQNRPIGTDFSNVYAAGTYVLEGKAHLAFDWPAQHARERAIFGENTPFYGWHYPPFFLFIAGAYWYVSRDEIGTTALVMTGALAFLVAFYTLYTSRRVWPRSSTARTRWRCRPGRSVRSMRGRCCSTPAGTSRPPPG